VCLGKKKRRKVWFLYKRPPNPLPLQKGGNHTEMQICVDKTKHNNILGEWKNYKKKKDTQITETP